MSSASDIVCTGCRLHVERWAGWLDPAMAGRVTHEFVKHPDCPIHGQSSNQRRTDMQDSKDKRHWIEGRRIQWEDSFSADKYTATVMRVTANGNLMCLMHGLVKVVDPAFSEVRIVEDGQ